MDWALAVEKRRSFQMKKHSHAKNERYFKRMTLNQRIQHITLMSSFFMLVLTGFPVTFPTAPASPGIVRMLGGFTMRSALHRTAATVLICLSIYHIFYLIFAKHGRSEIKALTPKFEDLLDAIDMLKFYVGLIPKPPQFDRFTYIEKFEYLALAWGSVVMIATGFMLWFQDQTLMILPKWTLDVAKVIHSYEALLAFLAIIIWHFYHVHLNPEVYPMSRVWLDGKISEHELKTLHPLEYERIIAQEAVEKAANQQETALVKASDGTKKELTRK
jgi:cytochrome b subunit of formate dehydrogenase